MIFSVLSIAHRGFNTKNSTSKILANLHSELKLLYWFLAADLHQDDVREMPSEKSLKCCLCVCMGQRFHIQPSKLTDIRKAWGVEIIPFPIWIHDQTPPRACLAVRSFNDIVLKPQIQNKLISRGGFWSTMSFCSNLMLIWLSGAVFDPVGVA